MRIGMTLPERGVGQLLIGIGDRAHVVSIAVSRGASTQSPLLSESVRHTCIRECPHGMATLALAGIAKVTFLDQIFQNCGKWLFQTVGAPVIIGLRLIAVWAFHRCSFPRRLNSKVIAVGVCRRLNGALAARPPSRAPGGLRALNGRRKTV
jgi:hypothetical protein